MALAPTLMQFVPRRSISRLIVADGLTNRQWVRSITGGVAVPATAEYLQLWHAVSTITLSDSPDRLVWRWESDGRYSVQSAYQALHCGAQPIPGCVRVWEVWAPLRVKLFLWLALRRRQWTADRRRRHGLDTHDSCWLCDQEDETIDHIVVECSFAHQLWFEAASELGANLQQQPAGLITDWWDTWRNLWPPKFAKGADTLFALVAWELWKERNARCFRGAKTQIQSVKAFIKVQASLWVQAGAKDLGRLIQRVIH